MGLNFLFLIHVENIHYSFKKLPQDKPSTHQSALYKATGKRQYNQPFLGDKQVLG